LRALVFHPAPAAVPPAPAVKRRETIELQHCTLLWLAFGDIEYYDCQQFILWYLPTERSSENDIDEEWC
jgi:hypothetical protein